MATYFWDVLESGTSVVNGLTTFVGFFGTVRRGEPDH